MERAIVGVVIAVLCLGSAAAQGFVEGLEAAEAKIEAKQWQEALEILVALQQQVELDEDAEVLAARLDTVGKGLIGAADFESALRACRAALVMRRTLHGEDDHQDVARSLSSVAYCLHSLGRGGEALTQHEAALAMWMRLYGDRDHPEVATSLNNVAYCLQSLGRAGEALPQVEAALAMRMRLYGDRDHPEVAQILNNVAGCLESLGRVGEALPQYEAALAMHKRLHVDRDHPDVAASLISVAAGLQSLGRGGEALPQFETALAMQKRLNGDRDHPHVAASLNNLAYCLHSLGRGGEALTQFERSLAMQKRLNGDRDHPHVAASLNNVAYCLQSLGRAGDALPQIEAALAMRMRLYGDRDHPEVAGSLSTVAGCLEALGRSGDALPQFEVSLAMWKRLYGDRDHPEVAGSLSTVAYCLHSLGRSGDALPRFEAALAMQKRLYGDRDHPDVARSLSYVAGCLGSLGRAGEALPQHEAALAMNKRLFGDRDHPDVAGSMSYLAGCLGSLGRAGEALPWFEAALAMNRRLYRDRDHPEVASSLNDVAYCLESLGRASEALPKVEQALAIIERLRDETRTADELRRSLFEALKRGGAFERFQRLANQAGQPAAAVHAAERSRGRELLDQLAQVGDPDAEAQRRARLRGDEAAADRLAALRTDIETKRTESDRLLHELTSIADLADDTEREQRRAVVRASSDAVNRDLRQLLDERARLLGDVLPVGRVRTAAEIQSALREGELLLEFTVAEDVALLYVLARDGEVQALELPQAFATVQRLVPTLLQRSSHTQLRGRDPEGKEAPATDAPTSELFASLIPASVWERVRASQRVFVAAHRELHRLPFELLVTDLKDGRPVHWLESGPPISYVPSGTALHWTRQRAREAGNDTTSLDLLAVGDPRRLDAEPEVPEQGVFVLAVSEDGEGARVGLQPGDVLVSYDGQPLADDKALRDTTHAVSVAVEDGKRDKELIPVGVWRRGNTLTVEVNPGSLRIEVGGGRARHAYEASLGSEAEMARITRSGDLERIGKLPPLRGARAETEAIETVFAERQAKTRRLLGADATEPAVFDLAAKAKYLHFACHGIAEEYAGQSFSMLVLSPPQRVLPGDDGLLKLGDLLNAWRGRLSSCRLVVLSACRTNVGATLRDEGPQALPIGFLFAGVPAVISSLWAVDDASTKELMVDFYSRLLAGETDKLLAFTAAKKALRAKYPDPFHWAPFLYMGAPE